MRHVKDEYARTLKNNERERYNSGWQDGFCDALDYVMEAINREYNEADREGDDEYINEHIAGWNHVENIIKEMKESYSGKENGNDNNKTH